MVGAGIFALLGQAAVYAGAAVWLSFLLAGLMSAALGYTLVKFGVRYPSSGGLVAYLMHGYRSRRGAPPAPRGEMGSSSREHRRRARRGKSRALIGGGLQRGRGCAGPQPFHDAVEVEG